MRAAYRPRLSHVYRWTTTSLGPLNDGLLGRKGEPCRIFARAARVNGRANWDLWAGIPPTQGAGSLGIEFADGARFVVPFYAVRAAAAAGVVRSGD